MICLAGASTANLLTSQRLRVLMPAWTGPSDPAAVAAPLTTTAVERRFLPAAGAAAPGPFFPDRIQIEKASGPADWFLRMQALKPCKGSTRALLAPACSGSFGSALIPLWLRVGLVQQMRLAKGRP